VRPPDENQHGSTRPNLLSGARRRFGGDDNILERLERDSARHASGNRSRAAWYGAAASLMLLLIIVVGWMAYERASTVEVIPMKRAPAESGPALVTTDEAAAVAQPPRSVPSAPPSAAAVIVPFAAPHEHAAGPAPVRNGAVAALPPLVLLSDENATARKPATPVNAGARAPSATSPRATAPVRAAQVAQQPATSARSASRPVVAVARPRKSAAGNPGGDPSVDRDVALLSAIIIHDSAHAEEKAQLEAAAMCMRASVKKCQGELPGGSAAKTGAR
jgi:hypothetical protein